MNARCSMVELYEEIAKMKVAKFGGSSLASATQIKKVAQIIKEDKDRKFIVVSAPGKRMQTDTKMTDLLINIGQLHIENESTKQKYEEVVERFQSIVHELELDDSVLKDITKSLNDALEAANGQTMEQIKAFGEDSSAKVVAAYLRSIGVNATYLHPKDAGLFVTNEPGNAQVLSESFEYLYSLREKEDVLIIPGFFGVTVGGDVITFSRGGSDITGSLVAAGVKASLYENFTDVDSVYSVNPQLVENPKEITRLTYKEMRELSYAGFSVFHDEALIPAFDEQIPVCIKNTNNPSAQGTMIVSEKDPKINCVVGIASDEGFCSFYVSKYLMNREIGFGRKLLRILEDEQVSFEHMPSGIDDITVILRENQLTPEKEEKIVHRIKNELHVDTIKIQKDLAIIMVVGEGMKSTVGMAKRATAALSDAQVNIEMINQGSSEVSMMFGIQAEGLERAIQSLYKAFFE